MNKTYPTLYKKTATGAIQIWYMMQDANTFCSVSGQIDGKKTQSEFTECFGKNVGKKNETSAVEQAALEIEAQYKKKLSQGNYKDSIEDVDVDNFFKPMLANKYVDHPVTDIQCQKGLVYSQPKLDGCVSGDTVIVTDKGKMSAKEIFNSKKQLKILSYNEKSGKLEFKKILNKMKDGTDIKVKSHQWYELERDNGLKLKATGNHLVYLPDIKCYRRVDDLKENDKFLII